MNWQGGFAGITNSKEIDLEKLPDVLQEKIRRLLDGKEPFKMDNFRPRGAADYLNYKIRSEKEKGTRL